MKIKNTDTKEVKREMKNNKKPLMEISMIILLCLLLLPTSLALNTEYSNESVQAKDSINLAKKDILEMSERDIPIKRVNETYQEALQLYFAQLALEEKKGKADYKIVIESALKINSVKKIALESNDELKVFKETFENAEKEANLSEMQEEYNQIILSFKEERFEDTLKLIKKGYIRVSEIQSSQTTVKMFYSSVSNTIKGFLIKNGLKIAIISSIAILFLIIFWKTFIKIKMRLKLNNLILQKSAINELLKGMQSGYFKTKKMSETEYRIKLKKFGEMTRELDRQIMVLKEEMFKTGRRKETGRKEGSGKEGEKKRVNYNKV